MTNPILIILLMIIALFIVLLLIKRILSIKFCVICTSVSITWITLLVLYSLGKFPHPIFIAVLMGQSVVGIYYLLEKRLKEKYHVFRLPFLLSVTAVAYALLQTVKFDELSSIILVLFVLWLISTILYMYRNDKRISKIFKQVIACCRDW